MTLPPTSGKRVLVAMRTGAGLNDRPGHWSGRARRVKRERTTVGWALHVHCGAWRPTLPCVVTLTRCAPSNGLDDDNLAGALKATRDAVAEWLGVDDGRRELVRYVPEQRRAKDWWVVIEFEELPQREAPSSTPSIALIRPETKTAPEGAAVADCCATTSAGST